MTSPDRPIQIENALGVPYAYAVASFYLTGTTTPQAAYSDKTLLVPILTSTADVNGKFPQIFLNPAVQYRMIVKDSTGVTTLFDFDPVNDAAFGLTSALIIAALGYTPINPAAAVFTGQARLTYAAALTALNDDSVGFRGRPQHVADTGLTLTLDDAGKMLIHDDTSTVSYLVPADASVAFPIGTVVHFRNTGTGIPTLVRDTGVTLRLAGSATSKDLAIAQWGSGTLVKEAANTWFVTASNGVS